MKVKNNTRNHNNKKTLSNALKRKSDLAISNKTNSHSLPNDKLTSKELKLISYMRKVEKAAIEFIQQNKSLDGHSVYFQKSLQKESTAYTNLWELVRKFKVVSFLNPLISLNRNVPLHETNKVTIIVANDCLFDLDNYMKASCKKRDRKYRQKVDDREIQGSKNTEDNPKHSTISDCRELLATY